MARLGQCGDLAGDHLVKRLWAGGHLVKRLLSGGHLVSRPWLGMTWAGSGFSHCFIHQSRPETHIWVTTHRLILLTWEHELLLSWCSVVMNTVVFPNHCWSPGRRLKTSDMQQNLWCSNCSFSCRWTRRTLLVSWRDCSYFRGWSAKITALETMSECFMNISCKCKRHLLDTRPDWWESASQCLDSEGSQTPSFSSCFNRPR